LIKRSRLTIYIAWSTTTHLKQRMEGRGMERIESGLEGIAVAATRLSHVDGAGGRLWIGGYAVEDMAPNACFEEVLYLLWYGHAPTARQADELTASLAAARELPSATLGLLRAAAAEGVGAMDALRMGVDTLSLTDACAAEGSRDADITRAIGLVARAATVAAAYARLRRGLEPVAPSRTLGHAANYLYMLEGRTPARGAARALETYLNTVIDHGMNASTFTARVVASTRSDMYSAVVGALGALKGPLHGGAPGPALDMVFEIRRRAAASGRDLRGEAEAYVRALVAAGERIMGFGHRVYRVRDPRADVLGRAAAQLFATPGERSAASAGSLYDDVRAVEAVVLQVLGELKPGRRIATNVEFYTALLLHGIGLEAELFTPTFAVARMGGWTAHVLEQTAHNRLIRPDATYVGPHHPRWGAAGERLGA
jgi:citrate synthase